MAEEQKNKNNQKDIADKSQKDLRKIGFYYSTLTVLLIFCLIQVGYGAILNILKLVSYNGKKLKLEKTLQNAEQQNKELKENIKLYSTSNNLEGIARNTLKMAGEDEVLIIINNNQPDNNGKKNGKDKNVK